MLCEDPAFQEKVVLLNDLFQYSFISDAALVEFKKNWKEKQHWRMAITSCLEIKDETEFASCVVPLIDEQVKFFHLVHPETIRRLTPAEVGKPMVEQFIKLMYAQQYFHVTKCIKSSIAKLDDHISPAADIGTASGSECVPLIREYVSLITETKVFDDTLIPFHPVNDESKEQIIKMLMTPEYLTKLVLEVRAEEKANPSGRANKSKIKKKS